MKFTRPNPVIVTLILCCIASNVSAELFKCRVDGHPTYQSHPCANPQTGSPLTIKESTPEEKAHAQEKLQAIRSQYENEKTLKQQDAQKQLEKQLQTRTIDLK